MPDWNVLADVIATRLGSRFVITDKQPVGGGCINDSWIVVAGQRYFLKLNQAARLDMFVAESAGLTALANSQTIRVPQSITCGVAGSIAFLLLEHLPLKPTGNVTLLAEQLAALHAISHHTFGFDAANFIGSSVQKNTWRHSWPQFWQDQRLSVQLELAARHGYRGKLQKLGEQLLLQCPALLNHAPAPALLHGDLWSGNFAYLPDGTPVLFDPACYYGDRECDIAMTELFGGFEHRFYQVYRSYYPLDAAYRTRRELYNLYHILNHANLFGGGTYLVQAERMMQQLLSNFCS